MLMRTESKKPDTKVVGTLDIPIPYIVLYVEDLCTTDEDVSYFSFQLGQHDK